MASKKPVSKNLYGTRKKKQKEISPTTNKIGTQARKKKTTSTTEAMQAPVANMASQWPGTVPQASNTSTTVSTQARTPPAPMAYGPPAGIGQGVSLPPWTPSTRPGEETPQETPRVTGSNTTGAIQDHDDVQRAEKFLSSA